MKLSCNFFKQTLFGMKFEKHLLIKMQKNANIRDGIF